MHYYQRSVENYVVACQILRLIGSEALATFLLEKFIALLVEINKRVSKNTIILDISTVDLVA